MGSVQKFEQRCPFCGRETYVTDYYYKTQESYEFCESCGSGQSLSLLHDDTGAVMTRRVASYPIDGRLKIVAKNSEIGEILREFAIGADMPADEIYQHLRDKSTGDFQGIYFGDDYEHLCFHYLSRFDLQEVNGVMHFVVFDPIWQLRVDAINPSGTKISVRLKQLATFWTRPSTDNDGDLYEITVVDGKSKEQTTYTVSIRAINERGLLNLINYPEIISEICVE